MSYRDIQCERIGDLLVVRHNRAEKLNARTSQMYIEIMAALQQASEDESIVAVLLSARGRYFSAGMDFRNEPQLAYEVLPEDSDTVRDIKHNMPQRDRNDVATWPPVKFIEAFIHFDKPLFAAVNGPAIGEGFSSLLHCDVVYAADTAYFWAPFARAGVAPEFCATYLLPKRLGDTLAHAAMYLGQRISAGTAHQAGFVLEVLPAGEDFESSVIARINEGLTLAGPPDLRTKTLRAYKALIRDPQERRTLTQVCHREFDLIRQRAESGETQAVQAYFSKDLPS